MLNRQSLTCCFSRDWPDEMKIFAGKTAYLFVRLLRKLHRSAEKLFEYRQYLYYLFYFLVKLSLIKRKPKGGSSGIIIITRGGLGDLIYSFKFLQDLRISGKYSSYYLLVEEKYREILSSISLNYEIILWDSKLAGSNPFYFLNLLNKIRILDINTAINITPSRGIITDAIILLSGCENKFCHSAVSVFYPESIQKRMNSEYGAGILSSSMNNYERLSDVLRFLNIRESIKSSYHFLLNNIGHSADAYVVIAPFSSDVKRTWGIGNYTDLCRYLAQTIHVVLIGSSEQKPALQEIASEISNVEVKAGSFRETDIMNTIGKASLFVGNDSGPAHMAFYMDIPMIVMTGGGCFNEFFPRNESRFRVYKAHPLDCFGCAWKCGFSERYCLTKIENEEVKKDIRFIFDAVRNSVL